jgi:regulator of sirC expression with transglutaminase-like and TPR domain
VTAELAARVRSFSESPDGSNFDAALLVAEIIDPSSNLELASVAMATLVETFEHTGEGFPAELCRHMNLQGFQGATDGYYDLDNSRIDRVLANRRGIPISLAVVYLELARRHQVPACGINFPAHFLIQVDDQLIDPFAGQLTTREACVAKLEQANVDTDEALAPTTPVQLMMRMLNNIRGLQASQSNFSEALSIIDYQLILYPNQPELYLARAELWWRLGSPDAVRHELDLALAAGADTGLVDGIRAQLGPDASPVH